VRRVIKVFLIIVGVIVLIYGVYFLMGRPAISLPTYHEIKKIEAIIRSMTLQERDDHRVLNGSRRQRIASGSGTQVQDVNKLIKQFEESKKMMRGMMKMGMGKAMRGKGGKGGGFPGMGGGFPGLGGKFPF